MDLDPVALLLTLEPVPVVEVVVLAAYRRRGAAGSSCTEMLCRMHDVEVSTLDVIDVILFLWSNLVCCRLHGRNLHIVGLVRNVVVALPETLHLPDSGFILQDTKCHGPLLLGTLVVHTVFQWVEAPLDACPLGAVDHPHFIYPIAWGFGVLGC